MNEWFRNTEWTPEIERAFFERLGRSRTTFHKSQYLRIQAMHLADTGKPDLVRVAMGLIEKLLSDYRDDSQLASAYHQRGLCREHLGDAKGAIADLQEAIETERRMGSKTLKTTARLDLAWLVATGQHEDHYDTALQLASEYKSPFPIEAFRRTAALALIWAARGDPAKAATFAGAALDISGMKESGLPYPHKTLGLVRPDYAPVVVEKLRQLSLAAPRSAIARKSWPIALLLLPAILSLILLGAHFLRAGNITLVVVLFTLIVLLPLRRGAIAWIAPIVLGLGAIEWIRTMVTLVAERSQAGQPFVRLIGILGGVTLFTIASAAMFRTRDLRRWYGLGLAVIVFLMSGLACATHKPPPFVIAADEKCWTQAYADSVNEIIYKNWYNVMPLAAREAHIKGTVTLQFDILPDGTIANIGTVSHTGPAPYERAAVKALTKSSPLPAPEFKDPPCSKEPMTFIFKYNVNPPPEKPPETKPAP